MIACGYSLDLYCDVKALCSEMYPHRGNAESYFGRAWTDTVRAARLDGWVINKDRHVTCPKCNKRRRKP